MEQIKGYNSQIIDLKSEMMKCGVQPCSQLQNNNFTVALSLEMGGSMHH